MNELIRVRIENVDGVLVTTSNRVAEELGVLHKDLLKKIDTYGSRFDSAESFAQFYIPAEYKDASGKTNRNYYITEKGIAQLIGGYSAAVPKAFELNVAYINEFERMRQTLSTVRVPTTIKEALLIALEREEQVEKLQLENKFKERQIMELQPKGIFADAVSTSHTSILIGELAKILKGNGVEIGQNRLFRWLRENGYLIRRDGADFNMPTQKAMEKGLFRIKETAITKPDGSSIVTKTVKVTGEGQVYFVNLFLKKGIVA